MVFPGVSASFTHKLKRARERLLSGDVSGAQFLCEEVLQRAPRNPEALSLLGASHIAGGRPAQAVPLLEQALASAPRHGPTLEYLGLAQLMLGRYPDAERALTAAAALPGAPASVVMRLGIALLHQGRVEDAIATLERATALDPRNPDCRLNLGQALARAGREALAREQFSEVLKLDPARADAMFNLGVIALDRNELLEARQWFERALARDPGNADALVNLGIVHQREGRLDEALACFRRALQLDPASAHAANNLAHTLLVERQFGEARRQYLEALRLAPDMLEAHEGLAAACLALGRFKEAMSALREVLRLDPEHRGARAKLMEALFQDAQLDEAATAARHLLDTDPDQAGPYSTLGLVHLVRGELDQAIAVLERGFQRTGASSLLGMLTNQLHRVCDWDRWREAWTEMARRLEETTELGSPFWLLTEDTTAAQQLSYAQRWAQEKFGGIPSTPRTPPERSNPRSRLRIGYFSSDFHQHAVASLIVEVLELHDRSRFEVFAYSYGPEDGSALRARLKAACEHFIDVAWDPDDVVAGRIEADALDILVDLKGYTVGARTAILARRPCPIQINWLGYPGTMGAPFIDYIIADPFIIPDGHEGAYSERVLRLPHCYQPTDRRRPVAGPSTRADHGLPEEAFVFCCFNQAVKITPEIFACWMRLLAQVPGSVLWLLEDNPWATRNLKRSAEAHGVEPERLVFAPRVPNAQHLGRYRVADLALDTFPYTSHTTASDGLWLGCPLVALCGETFAARVSGSILTACGLPELVTYSLEDYETLALKLARDREYMAEIRARIAAARMNSPLFDTESFARSLERLYLDLVEQRA
jgi:protein O-GlcNAc transferase